MTRPEERYYKLNKFLLSASGLWPYQNVWQARFLRAIITIIMLPYVLVQLANLFTNGRNLDFIAEMLPVIVATSGTLCQTYARIINIDKIKRLLDRMWSDWALQKTENEIKIMHEHAETTKLLTFYFSLLLYAFSVIYGILLYMPDILDVILPMNESRPRPHQVEFYTDEERYYYLVRSHVFLGLLIIPTVFSAVINLFLAVTLHVCAMCELLGYRAERLFCVFQNARCDLAHKKKISYGNVTLLVQLHYNIIEFVGMIDIYQSLPFALDLLGIVIAMSLTLIQILTISSFTEKAIKATGLAVIELCYIFIYSNMGQKVTSMTSSVCEKVYSSAWYNADVLAQKSLLLIIQRRYHPLILTAYNFYIMSLQNFGMILQTAVSYCMFVRKI